MAWIHTYVVLPFNGIKRDCRIQAYRKSIPQCQSHNDLLLSIKCEGKPVSPGQKTSVTYRWNKDEAGLRCTHAGAWPFRAYMWVKKKNNLTKLRWVWCELSCWIWSTALQQCSGPFVDDPEAGWKGIAVVSLGFYRSECTWEVPQGKELLQSTFLSCASDLPSLIWKWEQLQVCSHRFWNRLRRFH